MAAVWLRFRAELRTRWRALLAATKSGIRIAIPVVVALVNLVAFVPGRLASRVSPAAVLREE